MIFSTDIVSFQYFPLAHLKSTVLLTNNSQQFITYKFRVTRQEFYKVVPKSGCLKPHQSCKVEIVLRKDGVAEANYDKFKCFYKTSNTFQEQRVKTIQNENNHQQKRLTVRINNLPDELQKTSYSNNKNSEVRSISNRNGQGKNLKDFTLQNAIIEKKSQITVLQAQINRIKAQRQQGVHNKKSSSSIKLVLLTLIGGVILGTLSTIWI